MKRVTLFVCLISVIALASGAAAQPAAPDINQSEWPALPAPKWIAGSVDQGVAPGADPDLKGILTPAGFKLEVVAKEPQVIDPVGLTFADDGTPYVLEWKKTPQVGGVDYEITYKDGTKRTLHKYEKRGGSIPNNPNSADWLKSLHDSDHDGKYEKANVVIDDLQIPSSTLIHDGWFYFTSQGRVIRRRQSEPGGKFDITEEIVRGLCGFNQHQGSGLAMTHDGWLLITGGDDDAHAEGSDGSRVDLHRTGGVFMCRPDGSKLQIYARGFRNPYRDVVFDQTFNIFHMDNDNEDGSKWQGCRLLHIQEEADYGWRLHAGVRCCWPDAARGAVSGELPGKMPAMMKTGRGAPAGLLCYNGAPGTAMPEQFRGWIIYPDVFRKLVRAYRVERESENSSTFKVVEQFDLMKSEDGYFRPCQAVQGPDGAIYIVDWRTNSAGPGWFSGEGKFGRIYRLTWSGTDAIAAVKPGAMDAWAKVAAMTNIQLWQSLNSLDFQLRRRVVDELVRRGGQNRETFVVVAMDATRPLHARASAIGAACRLSTPLQMQNFALQLVSDLDPDVRRLAAEALGRYADDNFSFEAFTELGRVFTRETNYAAGRAMALAIGAIGSRVKGVAGEEVRDIAVNYLSSALVSHYPVRDVFHYDAIIRGLERLGTPGVAAIAALAGGSPEMDGVINFAAMTALRSPAAAPMLDGILGRSPFLRTDERLISLFKTYRNFQGEPAPDMSAVGDWLLKNPQASEQVVLAALETLALVGDVDAKKVLPVIEKMLEHPSAPTRMAVMNIIGQQQLLATAPLLAKAMLDTKRSLEERKAALRTLGFLRSSNRFATIKQEKGVELVLDDVAKLAADATAGELRGDALQLLARIDPKKTEAAAVDMLSSGDEASVKAAVAALSAEPAQAKIIGKLYAEKKIDRALLPQVAAALQKHVAADKTGEFQKMLAEVYKGGLIVGTDEASLKELENMVKAKGDAARGKVVFLDSTKSQCAVCHQLEGIGGRGTGTSSPHAGSAAGTGGIGPDLTKIGTALATNKLIESILDPSREIKEGFGTWVLTTNDGQVYTGLKIAENDKAVIIRDPSQAEDILVPRGDVKELRPGQKSAMPDNVTSQLSYEQLIDLVAFLKDEKAQASLRGMVSRAWVVGPFAGDAMKQEEWETLADPLKPIKAANAAAKDLQWKRADIGGDGTLDLKPVAAKGGAAYVLVYAVSPKDQKVAVRMTGNGSIRATVNGSAQVAGVLTAQGATGTLSLTAGWNTLLVRVEPTDKGAIALGVQVTGGEGVRFGVRPE